MVFQSGEDGGDTVEQALMVKAMLKVVNMSMIMVLLFFVSISESGQDTTAFIKQSKWMKAKVLRRV